VVYATVGAGIETTDNESTLSVSTVDPTFTIASGYTGYSIQYSAGLLNATPVPEPAGWSVMLVGLFGLVGVKGFRRRKDGDARRRETP
jgi:PEP-CTERM motif